MRPPLRGFDAVSLCGVLVVVALVVVGLVYAEPEPRSDQAAHAAWQTPVSSDAEPGAGDGAAGADDGPAAGGPSRAAAADLVYVALGSSFAAGPGEGEVKDPRCGRTADSYPSQVADELGMRLVDATCGGATIADIMRPAAGAGAPIDAVTPDTSLVTITVGGNDLRYIPRIAFAACANARTGTVPGATCARRWPAPSPFPAAPEYAAVERSLVGVVDAVRARAPGARVLLVEYLPVVSADEGPCAALPLQPGQVAQTQAVGRRLSEVTAWVAVLTGAEYVSTAPGGAAHTVCSAQPWVTGWGDDLPFHPNAEGKAAMADDVIRALR